MTTTPKARLDGTKKHLGDMTLNEAEAAIRQSDEEIIRATAEIATLAELAACCPLKDKPISQQPWFGDAAASAAVAARCNAAAKRAADAKRLELRRVGGNA